MCNDKKGEAVLPAPLAATSAEQEKAPMTKELPSIDLLRQLLDYDPDTGLLTWKPRPVEMFKNGDKRICATWNTRYAGKEALSHVNSDGYKRGAINGVNYLAHRVCMAIHNGEWPKQEVDHISGDRLDNRIINLRDVSRSENNRNAGVRSDSRTGHPGVCWHKAVNKWVAQMWENGRHVGLGFFDNIDDAIAARKKAEKEKGYHPNHGKRKGRPKPP